MALIRPSLSPLPDKRPPKRDDLSAPGSLPEPEIPRRGKVAAVIHNMRMAITRVASDHVDKKSRRRCTAVIWIWAHKIHAWAPDMYSSRGDVRSSLRADFFCCSPPVFFLSGQIEARVLSCSEDVGEHDFREWDRRKITGKKVQSRTLVAFWP